jgi:excisionase family DNA binding protein
MTPKDDDTPRTVRQCAFELNVSPFTIRTWLGQRRIGFVRLGRAIRIPVDEIRRLLDDGMVPALPVSGVRRRAEIRKRAVKR